MASAFCAVAAAAPADDLLKRVEHKYADSAGVKIHYAALGAPQAPLVVMLHGFPDFWFSWRNQMETLAKTHRVAAPDLRGYNMSDKPKGVENYGMKLLVGDVIAVIGAEKRQSAIVAGHDWGGAIAWSVAMYAPQAVDKLIIVNLPHLAGFQRELMNNPEQQKNSQYARNFQQEGAHLRLTAEGLAKLVPEDVRSHYIEAYRKSDFEAMLNYYKRNYPRMDSAPADAAVSAPPPPKVKCPVLQFHGMKDRALLPAALSGEWDHLDNSLTLITLPNAGHWSHWDEAETVTKKMASWLNGN
jgi:pimeloyl-ACP methyl ester carboxylesterase